VHGSLLGRLVERVEVARRCLHGTVRGVAGLCLQHLRSGCLYSRVPSAAAASRDVYLTLPRGTALARMGPWLVVRELFSRRWQASAARGD